MRVCVVRSFSDRCPSTPRGSEYQSFASAARTRCIRRTWLYYANAALRCAGGAARRVVFAIAPAARRGEVLLSITGRGRRAVDRQYIGALCDLRTV